MLEKVGRKNDTGHALCRNLCEGWWQADYIVDRLKNKNIELGKFQNPSLRIVFDVLLDE